MATEHFVSLGGTVTDVSAKKPFDLVVELDGVELTVEVKGTAGDGTEVLLTRGEVEHHQGVHPNNALAVVAGIRLQGPPDAPEAVGGVLRVISPWTLQMGALTPLSYRYAIDSPTAP